MFAGGFVAGGLPPLLSPGCNKGWKASPRGAGHS